MRYGSTARRFTNLGVAFAFVLSTITASLAFALPQIASADTPDPVPPSETCEWYGSMSWDREYSTTRTGTAPSQHNHDHMDFWSTPVDGQECGGAWDGYATMDASASNECTTTTWHDEFSGNGSGYYYGSIQHIGDDLYRPSFNVIAFERLTGTRHISNSGGCGQHPSSSTWNDEVGPWSISSLCDPSSTLETYYVDPAAQAFSGSCT